MSDVEFARWETPFEYGDIQILETVFSNGGGYVGYPEEERLYEFAPSRNQPWGSFIIRLFHKETETVYRVTFDRVGAYRSLDEDGLIELWNARSALAKPYPQSFRVRKHLWSKESDVPFINHTQEGWSWMIGSENWCVEVLCYHNPTIDIEARIKPITVPASDFDQPVYDDPPLSPSEEATAFLLQRAILYREDGEKFYNASPDQALNRPDDLQRRRVFRMG